MHQTENESGIAGKRAQCSANSSSRSSSCSSKNNEPLSPSFGRYCHIVKRPDFDGYGFNLHSEKIKPGQYIGKVDANSPAEVAGLREGDQIIEVNGINIGIETHKQVVQRIKAISNEVRLLLIDSSSESLNFSTKTRTNIPEKNSVNCKSNTNAVTNQTVSSKVLTTEPSAPADVAEAGAAAAASLTDQKEYVKRISMVSKKSQLIIRNNSTTNATPLPSATNGQYSKPNKEVGESVESPQEHRVNNSPIPATNKETGLNLNLTAAEMRAKLLAKKKFDPKNESVDLKKKFDIIQKL